MREAITSMCKRKLVLLFILLQLVFSYLLIVDSCVEISQLGYRQRQMDKYTKLDLSGAYRMGIRMEMQSPEDIEKVLSFEEQLRKGQEEGIIVSYGTMDKAEIAFTEREFMRSWMELLQKKFGKNAFRTEAIQTDFSIYNRMKLGVSAGRLLDEKDFTHSSSTVPVLVGWDLREIFPIGSTISIRAMNVGQLPCEVVGVLKRGSSFLVEGFHYGRFDDLDFRWVIPYHPLIRDRDGITIKTRTNQALLEIDGPKEEALVTIRRISERTGIPVVAVNLETRRMQEEEANRGILLRKLVLSVILLIVAISGMVSSTLSSLEERKYELGVRLAVGYTKARLVRQVGWEMLLLNGTGLLIAYGYRFFVYKQDAIAYEYSMFPVLTDYYTLGAVGLTLCFVLAISIIFPQRTINKMEIVDLLRGGE